MRSVGRAKETTSLALLAFMAAVSALLYEPILDLFEAYDHVLNTLAFHVGRGAPWVPGIVAHEVIMGLGFAVLGAMLAVVPAALGRRGSWVIVGFLLLFLNISWWYTVESNVAQSRPEAAFLPSVAVIITYVSNSSGAFLGAFLGEKLGLRITLYTRERELSR